MENQDKYSKFDRAILAICLIVVLLCGFLMIDGRFLFSGDDTSKLAAVGQIEQTENDVRQKHQTGFTWRGSRGEDVVYEGDSIFTGNGSKAKIKFAKGGQLEIDSKSLVVIKTNNGKLELNLLYGAFSGNLAAGEKIVVIKDGEKSELAGPMKINTPVKKTQKASKNIALLSPENNILYWSGEINYSWSSPDQNASYVIEFSNGASFKTKIGQIEVTGNELSSTPHFPVVGKSNKRDLFWRVRSAQNKNSISEIRKITLYKDLPPALTVPLNKTTLLVEPDKEETKVANFKWSEPGFSQNYTFQIAKDEGFNELVVSQTIEKKEFTTSTLSQGEYFWRVQGNHSARSNSPWSEVRKLTVFEKQNIIAPKVTSTDKTYVLPFAKVIKTPATKRYEQQGVPVSDFPFFKWSPVAGVASYQLEVSKEKSFEHFATQNVVPPKTDFHFTVMKPGLMAWRVRSVLPNGETTDPSDGSYVQVTLPPPQTKKPEQQKNMILASWSPLLFARYYELQWDTNQNFSSARSTITQTANYKVVPDVSPILSLYWRVRALDQAKRPLSEFTQAEPLRIVRKLAGDFGADETLNKPVPREPRSQSSVVSFDDAPVFINFKWSRVRQIQTYRFELSTDPDFIEEPVFTSTTQGNQQLLNQKLQPGQYFWRVRGENEDGSWTVWSDPAPFFVQFK